MQYKHLIFGLSVLIILAGCTQQASTAPPVLNEELSCPPEQEICVLGNPGLLNELSIYSDSDTVFSIILRNNLKGDEANNVEIKLKNLSPFYVIEGYDVKELDERNINEFGILLDKFTCSLSQGVWKPHEIRRSLNVPEPQFISDLDLPFASKMLDVMYPNEEVEFLWNLRTPSRQEIANVAYEHSIDYEISYDYKTSILQTLYAVSEQEYQRMLSLGEDINSKKGTITSSIGALNVASNTEEPIRVTGFGSQFSMTFKVNNKRSGIPLTPALFVLQYPNGTDFVGAFNDKESLSSYGYIDLKAAAEIFNQTDNMGGQKICIPADFDIYDELYNNDNIERIESDNLICPTYDELIDYIKRNFKDLEFDKNSPNLVLKFLYPINLINEMNYLYYPMITTEDIDVSKYYTFRLKAKYRYSFSGKDDIIIVPSEQFYNPSQDLETSYFFGDMGFNFDNNADSYNLNNETLEMAKDDYLVNSSVFELKNGDFLHLVSFESLKEPITKPCASNNECVSDYFPLGYCDSIAGVCNYTYYEQETTQHSFSNPDLLPKLANQIFEDEEKGSEFITSELDYADFCESGNGQIFLKVFGNLISGNFSVRLKTGPEIKLVKNLNDFGEFFISESLLLNCSTGNEQKIIFNSTYNGTKAELYNIVIVNASDIIFNDFGLTGSNNNYVKISLEPGEEILMEMPFNFKKNDVFNHYIYYKTLLGKVRYSLNSSGTTLSSINWAYANAKYEATADGNTIQVRFKNEQENDSAIIYLSQTTEAGIYSNINHTILTEKNGTILQPFYYNIKLGYSPLDGFLKKIFENSGENILLDKPAYYINHLPYSSLRRNDESRAVEENHYIEFDENEGAISKAQKVEDFIDYRSFLELNELNLLNEEGLINVFSDNDYIGYQLRDYDYSTQTYLNLIPPIMKLMSYYESETVYFKRFDIDDNAFSLIILYSDKIDASNNKLMFYLIDHRLSENNPLQANYFNISLVQGNDVTVLGQNKLFLNNTFIPVLNAKKELPYEELSMFNLRGQSGIIDCSTNYNLFGQTINKKPALLIEYKIKYGLGNTLADLPSIAGSLVIGDYSSLAEINQNFNNIPSNSDFVRGVVNVCKKQSGGII